MPRIPNIRDKIVGKYLRERADLKHSRFESYTVVRQFLGNKVDVDKVSLDNFIFTLCINLLNNY